MATRIPQETIQRVIDAADIVDVVSDYVTLKRRGSNHWGLCPFHNERTPSFAVSKAKGIYKCFSCGKAGGPVNFVMEMEQAGFSDAIRILARKFGIPIEERELTPDERDAENKRQSMLALNEFALAYFHHTLLHTDEGRAVGLSYFRERGISDAMIERFGLGYAPDSFEAFRREALSKGYTEELLLETGLLLRSENGKVYDRFRGRVIFPIFSVSGKPVAFGGRVLSKEKQMAKYVNSPESVIYSKRSELYGLYHARQAVNKAGKCLLVEGYMDVISMSQSGIANVVASSGTSLTTRQANLIHRFTDNVTLIYDADPAGIKASLRGIDILLAEGLRMKVVNLPEGDDPDSFAQAHPAHEVEKYIADHEEDFIRFKTRILMAGLENDPIARARVISDVVRSIAVIPDEIQRQVYVQECSHMLNMDAAVLSRQVARDRNEALLRLRQEEQRRLERGRLDADPDTAIKATEAIAPAASKAPRPEPEKKPEPKAPEGLRRFELQLLRYAMLYGNCTIALEDDGGGDDNSQQAPTATVVECIAADLRRDDVWFTHPDIARCFDEAAQAVSDAWPAVMKEASVSIGKELAQMRTDGIEHIRVTYSDLARIERAEADLEENIAAREAELWQNTRSEFMNTRLLNHPEADVRRLASSLMISKYRLSKIHSTHMHVPDESERLSEFVWRAIFELKDAILALRIENIRASLVGADPGRAMNLLQELNDMSNLRAEFAKCLGDRIIDPRRLQN